VRFSIAPLHSLAGNDGTGNDRNGFVLNSVLGCTTKCWLIL
jgi:hypothetical protein